MLTRTEAAGAHLAKMLIEAEAADDVATRIARVAGGWTLQMDSTLPSDIAFELGGRIVLIVDERVSEMLSDKTVDLEDSEEGPKLAVF